MEDRVLVIANAALSLLDSNGRTMARLLTKYKPEQLAQFYTYGNPDKSICSNYYHVSDTDALRSFVKRNEFVGKNSFEEFEHTVSSISTKKRKRTPTTMLLRELVWKHSKWCNNHLFDWLKSFNPTVIFINLADNIFLIDFALKVSRFFHIPVVVYSTEEYPFKKYNYLTKKPSILYWVFYLKLNNAYRRLAPYVICGYFNSPMLRDEYARRYPYCCKVAMNSSQIDWIKNEKTPQTVRVSYLGNLGLNRHLPLIEIANAIAEVLPGTKLDIYGKIPNEIVSGAFANCPNINYVGYVSYEEVIKIIHESTLVVHAETQSKFYVRDLKFGFSTKIADYVCSGTPMLIYGNESMASINFIETENCAFLCTKKENLVDVVRVALTNVNERNVILKNAMNVRKKYFNDSKVDLMSE